MEVTNYKKVLEVFFDYPTERFYIREIARLTKLNPNTILTIVDRLLDDELIIKEKKKHIVELTVNNNEKFKKLKRISNFSAICQSGIVEFLNKEFDSEAISIIGSYSRGEDIKTSDIDLVIISKKEYKTIDLNKFEKTLKRKIHLIITNYDKMSDEFYINFINGLILYGYINKKSSFKKNI